MSKELLELEYNTVYADNDWTRIKDIEGVSRYQHNKCFHLFKQGGVVKYMSAIIFRCEDLGYFLCTGVYVPKDKVIDSFQAIKRFPFVPKTFYVDIGYTVSKDGYRSNFVKDARQLNAIYEYYDVKLEPNRTIN